MKFRELIEDNNKTHMKNIEKAFKKAGFDIGQVSAFGTYGDVLGITLNIKYNTKKEAENVDIKGTLKILNNMFTDIEVDKKSKDYENGTSIQSQDWRYEGDNDPHEIYIIYKGKM